MACAPAAGATRAAAHGHVVHVTEPGLQRERQPRAATGSATTRARRSGARAFHSIAGDWTVPSATAAHDGAMPSRRSTWIGIGGGCTDAQVHHGRQHADPDRAPSRTSRLPASRPIRPVGDRSPAAVVDDREHDGAPRRPHAREHHRASPEGVGGVAHQPQDLTRPRDASKRPSRTSSRLRARAEWIEETPIVIGTNAGLADLPTLSRTTFDRAKVNGAARQLKAAERILLTTSNGKVIGTPSAPDSQHTASPSARGRRAAARRARGSSRRRRVRVGHLERSGSTTRSRSRPRPSPVRGS